MMIFLIRHVHARDGDDDARRPLSDKGRRQIRTMARFLRRSGRFVTREFWHSPLVRARDTASLLAAAMKGESRLVETAGLEPHADPAFMAERLRRLRRSVAVVGHEPHLSALATWLLLGRPGPPVTVLKKGAVAAFERKDGRWLLRWQVSPNEAA